MRNGFEGIFDLVQAAFWGEDGCLQAELIPLIVLYGCDAVLTRESYLRDMAAVYSQNLTGLPAVDGLERVVGGRGRDGGENGLRWSDQSSRHKLLRVSHPCALARPLF